MEHNSKDTSSTTTEKDVKSPVNDTKNDLNMAPLDDKHGPDSARTKDIPLTDVLTAQKAVTSSPASPKARITRSQNVNSDTTNLEPRLSSPVSSITTISTVSTLTKEQISSFGWVQCENPECLKWRKLPNEEIDILNDTSWFCYMNLDPDHKTCDDEEEDYVNAEKNARRMGLKYVASCLPPGTLVWAKMVGYCSWPAIVCADPMTGLSASLDSDDDVLSYHVEYLGAKHSHSWVAERHVELYGPNTKHANKHLESLDITENLKKITQRKKKKYHRGSVALSQATQPKIRRFYHRMSVNSAVQEAEQYLDMSPSTRLKRIKYVFTPDVPEHKKRCSSTKIPTASRKETQKQRRQTFPTTDHYIPSIKKKKNIQKSDHVHWKKRVHFAESPIASKDVQHAQPDSIVADFENRETELPESMSEYKAFRVFKTKNIDNVHSAKTNHTTKVQGQLVNKAKGKQVNGKIENTNKDVAKQNMIENNTDLQDVGDMDAAEEKPNKIRTKLESRKSLQRNIEHRVHCASPEPTSSPGSPVSVGVWSPVSGISDISGRRRTLTQQISHSASLIQRTKEEKFLLDIEMYRRNEAAFEHDVRRFMARNGKLHMRLPIWQNIPVTLFQLFLAVYERGGYEGVTKVKGGWVSLYQEMTCSNKTNGHVAKDYYKKNLLPYELYLAGKDYRRLFKKKKSHHHHHHNSKNGHAQQQEPVQSHAMQVDSAILEQIREVPSGQGDPTSSPMFSDTQDVASEDELTEIDKMLRQLEEDGEELEEHAAEVTMHGGLTDDSGFMDVTFYDEDTPLKDIKEADTASEFGLKPDMPVGAQEVPDPLFSGSDNSEHGSEEEILHEMEALQQELDDVQGLLELEAM